jgi:hypothetical protein
MRLLYNLKRYIPTFNFFEWLLVADWHGVSKVVFDIRDIRTTKWDKATSRRRFFSICEPGPALLGLEHETFDDGDKRPNDAAEIPNYKTGGKPLADAWKAGKQFRRLRSVKPPGTARFTVTLRNTGRDPARNSEVGTWMAFAKEIGARVIRDYAEEPMHLHDRVALYAGAEMNYFVSNGPAVFCSFTEYPCMFFDTNRAWGAFQGDDVPQGADYIWMLKNQRAIWEFATPEVLRDYHRHWLETGTILRRPGLIWNHKRAQFERQPHNGPFWNGHEFTAP